MIMTPGSKKTLDEIRQMMEERNECRRLMRADEVMKIYPISKHMLNKLAVECGARLVINKLAVIDMDIFEPYYKKKKGED